jgi:hypothetical protein
MANRDCVRRYWLKNKEKIKKRQDAYYQKNKEKARQYRKDHPELMRNYSWKNYGIKNKDGSWFTHKDYEDMFKKQQGCCAICGLHQSNFKRCLSADHDHKTRVVRGLLCFTHNLLLGHAHDQIKELKMAIQYLEGGN